MWHHENNIYWNFQLRIFQAERLLQVHNTDRGVLHGGSKDYIHIHDNQLRLVGLGEVSLYQVSIDVKFTDTYGSVSYSREWSKTRMVKGIFVNRELPFFFVK